jgi:hypothetical protein
MRSSIDFVRLETSFKGLMTRAVRMFDRYLDTPPELYRWVCIENPELIARALEVLSEDLPEEDLARLVPRMPYLILLFHDAGLDPDIPVEATMAFLTILNRSELVTILRQCTDRKRLAPRFDLDPEAWTPVFFMVGGVPDLDSAFEQELPSHCSFF